MDAVTYPNPEVAEVLNERTVAVQINTAEPDPSTRQLMREFRQVWTPAMVWLDHHGIEVRREIGYLEPRHFVAVIRLAEGQAHLLHADFADALAVLDAVGEGGHPHAAPEALYWAGVAALRQGQRDQFISRWQTLKARYPDSSWWSRASFIDK